MKNALLQSLSRSLLKPYARLTRGKTLGVRVAVLDDAERIFLIKHTYSDGWYFPGGGVDKAEAPETAAIRELYEEGNIRALERPKLHGFYSNEALLAGDYIAFYVLRSFEREDWKPNYEITQAGFFSRAELPPETTPATRRRLAELFDATDLSDRW